MKKFISGILILCTVCFISCRKQTTAYDGGKMTLENTQALMRVMSTVSDDELKSAYLALTPEEKRAVWLAHFDTFKAKNSLTAEQLSSLNSLREFTNTVSFTDTNTNATTSFFNNWYSTAHTVFSDSNIYLICFTLFDNIDDELTSYRPYNEGGTGQTGPSLHCNCYSESSFSCVLNPSKCTRTGCIRKGYGCGFLALYACDKRCRII